MKRLALAVLTATLLAPAASPAAAAPPVEYAARHILVTFRGARSSEATRTNEEARVRCAKAIEAIRGGTPFEEVSRAYSDDKVSDQRGGFLGYFAPDQMDPRFSQAVAAAKDDELVGPVESDFGWHAIERLSVARANALLAAKMCVIRGATFAWKGAPGTTCTRTKDEAKAAAVRAAALLAASPDLASLPKDLEAASFPRPGWMASSIGKGMFRADFAAVEAEAFALAVGATSTTPIETPVGWVLLQRVAYFRVHVEHLVVLHKDAPGGAGAGVRRTKDEAKARAAEALAKVQAKPASWPAIVAEYSDEPGAGARDGSLGGVEPGTLVPEFEKAFLALAPGAFSGLVETDYGWHVIRRVD